MENWKDYVGVHEFDAEAKFDPTALAVLSLVTTSYTENDMRLVSMEIKPIPVICNMTELEVAEQVEKELKTFPIWKRVHANDTLNVNMAKNGIARQTYRGTGNTEFENVVFYKGPTTMDTPIIVAKYNGKYGIAKNPNFEKYGFVLE